MGDPFERRRADQIDRQSAQLETGLPEERFRMLRPSCLPASFLILFHVSAACAVESPDSRSAETFAEAREQIVRWASGFVAKKRNSIVEFPKLEAPFAGPYHYANERTVLGKTARKDQCALHLGRRRETEEWVFNLYLENKKRDALSFEGYVVLQSQPTVSNIEAVTSLDLHTTASSISLLSLEVYRSGPLGEGSLSIVLDDEDNITKASYRFINGPRTRDGRRGDPVTCYFDYMS
jgi:hypothetical protein